VGRDETLAQDFKHICRELNISTSLPHLNRSRHRDYRSFFRAQADYDDYREIPGKFFSLGFVKLEIRLTDLFQKWELLT